MNNRFFKTSAVAYAGIVTALDLAFGHPNGKADTCLHPANDSPHDNNGDVVAAVLSSVMSWPEVETMIAPLIDNGTITEITEQDYRNCIPLLP